MTGSPFQRAANMIPAHDSPLAALAFDASGTKLATASEKVRMRAPWRAGPQVSADSCAAHTGYQPSFCICPHTAAQGAGRASLTGAEVPCSHTLAMACRVSTRQALGCREAVEG